MIRYIQVVTVFVKDQDQALAYYIDKLGFVKREDIMVPEGGRWVEVGPADAQATISLTQAGGDFTDRAGIFTGIVFDSADCHATYEELKARGVTFTMPPEKQSWGMTMAMFADLDQNIFMIVGP